MNKLKLYILIIFIQFLWSLTPSISKIILEEIPVELFVAIRWTISGFLFWLICLIKKVTFNYTLKKSFLGILGYGVASILALYGLKLGGVINFALLSTVNPIITATLAIFILKEKISNSYKIAFPLTFLALVILVYGKYEISSLNLAFSSSVFILLAYMFEAYPFIVSKKSANEPLFSLLAIYQLSTAFFMWFLQFIYFDQTALIKQLSLKGILSILFIAIGICVVCYAVYFYLLRKMDGHVLALFDGLHSIFAVIIGYILFNEVINSTMIVGGGLLLISLYLGTRK